MGLVSAALAATTTSGFVLSGAGSLRGSRSDLRMSADEGVSSRRQFLTSAAQALGAAALLGSTKDALADPKGKLLFRILSVPDESEGQTLYSPLSPYADGQDAIFDPSSQSVLDQYVQKVNVVAQRIAKCKDHIAEKKWYKVEQELHNQAGSLREAMTFLADASANPKAQKTMEAFNREIEELSLAAERKDGKGAQKAYDASMQYLASFYKECGASE